MAGTKLGGQKAANTNKQKYGEDFYTTIGSKGGSVARKETRAFFKNRELARTAGAKGGRASKRKKV